VRRDSAGAGEGGSWVYFGCLYVFDAIFALHVLLRGYMGGQLLMMDADLRGGAGVLLASKLAQVSKGW